MKGIFNACDKKNLKLNNPDYVKQYKTGREYFGWEDALSSACIKTNFGIFTSAKRTRVKNDKGTYEYFITLANEKEEITLKQNQLCNKKMPKNAIRVSKVNTFIFKGFKHQLCLPVPKDIIEEALEEISRLSIEQNKLRTWKQELDYYKAKRNIDCNHLSGKLGYIINFGKRLGFDTKSFMNKVLKMYHPDKNPNVTEEEYEIVKRMWDLRK